MICSCSRWALSFCALIPLALVFAFAAQADEVSDTERRLAEAVKYLASDELEGRGVGTKGLDLAADYIAAEFTKLGLKTDLIQGSPFQKFTITTSAELGPKEENRITLVGPPAKEGEKERRIELKSASEFNTLAVGGSGTVDAPVIYVGYGITGKDEKYDDYEGLDVKGKVVLIVRKEPQQDNPHSVFNGTDASQHATFMRKIANASEHGVAAVLLVNDQHSLRESAKKDRKELEELTDKLADLRKAFKEEKEPNAESFTKFREQAVKHADRLVALGKRLTGEYDTVLNFTEAGTESTHRKLPVFFLSRKAAEQMVEQSLGKKLAELEAEIDKDLKPRSVELKNWTVSCQSNIKHKQAEIKNVIGVLEGDGTFGNETIVVGAHYDHLGLGGPGNSLAPGTIAVHNGADDNASGSAALIEVARRLVEQNKQAKFPRRLVFMAFSGEERGLLGSAHYMGAPLFPLEQTVAMFNMDMVGRMDGNKLVVHGTGSAAEFDGMVDELNKKHAFEITKKPSGFGPSDHSSFYAKQIPVLHIFTGTHGDYHRPTDDFEKINVPGMRRVVDFVTDVTTTVIAKKERPQYKQTSRPMGEKGGTRPYLGSIPDFSREVDGYALGGVAKDSPAEKGGMKAGDVIIQLGESKITGLEDIDSALRKFKPGDQAKVVVKRGKDGKETVTLTITLEAPR